MAVLRKHGAESGVPVCVALENTGAPLAEEGILGSGGQKSTVRAAALGVLADEPPRPDAGVGGPLRAVWGCSWGSPP
jgi:hypothetical protein